MSVTVNESTFTVTINATTNTVEVASPGPAGVGVPTGGTTGQVLTKTGTANYETGWTAAGSGSVTSITPAADNGGGTAITTSGTITVLGGNVIGTSVSGTTVTVNHAPKSGTGTTTAYPASIEVDAYGHVVSTGLASTPVLPANNLSDVANAATARTNLGLGTAATSDTTDFEASGAVSSHSASTTGVHGISAFGASLVDDADATAARTTLGAAATNHNHAATQITSGTFDDARIASSNVTQHAGDINLLDLGNVSGTIYGSGSGIYYNGANWVAGSLTAGQIPTLTLSKISDAGTAAASNTGDFEASGAVSTHAAVTSGVHGISTFGATLIDDADAATARTTLGNVVNSPLVDLATLPDISAGSVDSIVLLTEAEYADISSPDANTIYVTTGGTTVGTTIQDSYLLLIEAPSDKDYTIDARVAATRTVTNFYAKTSSGTCTATLKNLTDATTIGTISVTSTGGSAASISNATLDENDRVGITISSTSSAADLEMVVEYNQ